MPPTFINNIYITSSLQDKTKCHGRPPDGRNEICFSVLNLMNDITEQSGKKREKLLVNKLLKENFPPISI